MTDSSKFFDIEPETKETLRRDFLSHMEWLRKQTVYENTLYRKWKFLQSYQRHVNKAEIVQANIWTPQDIFDREKTVSEIEELQPFLEYVETEEQYDVWKTLKIYLSSFPPTLPPGRNLHFVLKDKNTNRYLGVATISSDMFSLGVRDKWIGWTKEDKVAGRLQCSPGAQMVIATQPFGFNFLGGKLVAGMLCTQQVRTLWKKTTGNPLVGLTTTSLYGASSQYNSIPYWKTLGETSGRILLTPDDEVYEKLHAWVKKEYPEEYTKVTRTLTGGKNKIVNLIFKKLEISPVKFQHGHKRGVHYAALYSNTREFLRREIDENQLQLKPKLANDVEGIINWWKPRAIRRYQKLVQENRVKPNVMFYIDLMDKSWEETKEKYIDEVGR